MQVRVYGSSSSTASTLDGGAGGDIAEAEAWPGEERFGLAFALWDGILSDIIWRGCHEASESSCVLVAMSIMNYVWDWEHDDDVCLDTVPRP